MCKYKEPILCRHVQVQRTYPMWTCASTKNLSYVDMCKHKEPILWHTACSYTYYAQFQVRGVYVEPVILQLNTHREELQKAVVVEKTYMQNTEEGSASIGYRNWEWNQWPLQTCTQALKWNRMHVHVTMCVCMCVCDHNHTGLLFATCISGVYHMYCT